MRWPWLVLAACGHGASAAPPEVQVVVDWPAPASEVERRVTIPIERAVGGAPNLQRMRSVTRAGRAVITVDVRGSLLDARQEILARLPDADLPDGAHAVLGPMTSADGELVRYTLSGPYSAIQLRSWQDYTARIALLHVPGVADVSACGGAVEQLRIHADPDRLAATNTTVEDIATAVARVVAHLRDAADLRDVVIATRNGAPVKLGDVALVEDGGAPPTCVALDHDTPVIAAAVWLRAGDDRATVRAAVDRALDQLAAQLPSGAKLERVAAVARGTLELPPAAKDEDRQRLVRAALARTDALVELGRPEGGFESGADRGARVYLRSRDDGQRLAATDLPGTRWAADEPGAWIEVFGEDFDQLATALDRATAGLPVVARIGTGKLPELAFDIDRHVLARYNVDLGTVQDAIELLQHSRKLGTIFQGTQPIDVTLELYQIEPTELTRVAVRAGDARVPLSELVRVEERADQDVIVRDNGRRMVMARVADRGVAALRDKLASIVLPAGYSLAVEPAP